jgi:hypothetical protein
MKENFLFFKYTKHIIIAKLMDINICFLPMNNFYGKQIVASY